MISTFSPIKINSLTIPNRFVRSATFEALSNSQGSCTNQIIDLYKQYRNVGLVLSSCALTDDRGRHHPTMLSLSPLSTHNSDGNLSRDHLDSFSQLTNEMHKQGSCFGIQLVHSGLSAKKHLINNSNPEGPNTMSIADIERVINNFQKSAELAYQIGVDAIQIHSAHCYLLGSFLSSVSNKRTDEFGGSLDKRCELLRRIIRAIRSKIPSSFPLLVKLNGTTEQCFISNEELASISEIAADSGVDAIEFSVNRYRPHTSFEQSKKFFTQNQSDAVRNLRFDYTVLAMAKKRLSIPIISTGGHLNLNSMNNFIGTGLSDMIGLSRPLIRQPNLIELFKNKKTEISTCKQCDACLMHTSVKEKPLKCVNP